MDGIQLQKGLHAKARSPLIFYWEAYGIPFAE
jgi:hypothetical protein